VPDEFTIVEALVFLNLRHERLDARSDADTGAGHAVAARHRAGDDGLAVAAAPARARFTLLVTTRG